MRTRRKGRILITGSIAGLMPGTYQAVYNGTKAFLDNFAFALRAELKDSGDTVTCLMPGVTETDFFERADMLDTKFATQKKSSADDVARAGFEAMMKGEVEIVTAGTTSYAPPSATSSPATCWPSSTAGRQHPARPTAERLWVGTDFGDKPRRRRPAASAAASASIERKPASASRPPRRAGTQLAVGLGVRFKPQLREAAETGSAEMFPLRIAQVAPLYESVPPQLYGGTERVVHYLTEELIELGHDVTLFAAGDSRTRARLVSPCTRSLRLAPRCQDPVAYHLIMLDQLTARRNDFDVIHFHVDYLHFPLSRVLGWPQLTTLHGRLDLDHLEPVFAHFGDMPLVSISRSQRRPRALANWLHTVHHGLPENLLPFSPRADGYFAFLGRVSPEKRVDRAIEIALALGVPLKIAAKIDRADQAYFEREVAHRLDHPLVEYVGEIGEAEKADFLGRARALLFPIDWPEPFGLVMIEAMACGTPVIAFRFGSVPEVIDHGVTGFIVDDMREAVAAAARVDELDRHQVREVFDRRFTARRMAEKYVGIYRTLAAARDSVRITA